MFWDSRKLAGYWAWRTKLAYSRSIEKFCWISIPVLIFFRKISIENVASDRSHFESCTMSLKNTGVYVDWARPGRAILSCIFSPWKCLCYGKCNWRFFCDHHYITGVIDSLSFLPHSIVHLRNLIDDGRCVCPSFGCGDCCQKEFFSLFFVVIEILRLSQTSRVRKTALSGWWRVFFGI